MNGSRLCAGLCLALLALTPAASGFAPLSAPESADAVRLAIPALGLAAVPLTPLPIVNGAWDEARLGAHEVGLLETTGCRPGDELAMVIAGHVTLEGDQHGPFYGLGSLRPGALVVLHARDGREWRYRVMRQSLLQPGDVKSIYRRDGRVLLLLTCAAWDEDTWSYRSRLLGEARLDHEAAPTRQPAPARRLLLQ